MSLIREALRKAAKETDPPSPLPPETGKGGKGAGSSKLLQIVVVILLLICLAGVLVYSFFPTLLPLQKIQRPLALKPMAKKIEIKAPEPAANKEKGPSQQAAANKVEAKSPPAITTQGKQPPEQSPFKKPPEVSTPISTRFISPKSTPRIFSGSSASKRQISKTRPPREISEPPKAPLSPDAREEKDSLQVVRLFNEAVQNQQKGLYPQAIQAYQEILFIRPNHWETYNNLGLIYQEQKRFTQALEQFQKALSLNPRYLKGVNNLGLFYLDQGKLEEAANQFRKALDLDSSFLPANINLAVVLNRQGQVDQARKCLLKVLEYDSENIEAHYNLGLLWEKQGVEDKALEHYQKFVSIARGPYTELAEELKKRWPALK
jgi:Flp pilus assembly protein TadD